MMLNLFSNFEPSSSTFNLPLNWMACLLGLLFLPYIFWTLPSRWSLLWSKILFLLFKEMKPLLSASHIGTPLLFISFFVFIMFNNVLGLLPYVFTSSSHMTMTLTLSLPLWITLMTFGWMNNTQKMFASLVPQSTPTFLMPFMVLIETISNIIRPLTLAVRLSANMIAGHLLLTIMSSAGLSLSKTLLMLLLLSQIILLTLESAVAFIQSYVFAVLSTLYTSEIN